MKALQMEMVYLIKRNQQTVDSVYFDVIDESA